MCIKNNITGLTTAAGIWTTSGVGMSIGTGMCSVGIASTIIIIVAQLVLYLRDGWHKHMITKKLVIKHVTAPNYQEYIVG